MESIYDAKHGDMYQEIGLNWRGDVKDEEGITWKFVDG